MRRTPAASPASGDPLRAVRTRRARVPLARPRSGPGAPRRGAGRVLTAAFAATALVGGMAATSGLAVATAAPATTAAAMAPAVAATHAAVEPAPEIVSVTPDAYFTEGPFTSAPTSLDRCGEKDFSPNNTCDSQIASNPTQWPPDMTSQELWGAASNVTDRTRTGMGLHPAPAEQVTLGQPFDVLTFGVFNRPSIGDSPTSRAIRVSLTIQLPGETPFVFSLDDPDSPPATFGKQSPWHLNILDTDNVAPCDPTIQVTTVPCDDLYSLDFETLTGGGSSERPIVVEKVINGVTWKFQLLGFNDPLTGKLSPRLIAPERTNTRAQVLGVLTREGPASTTTTTSLTGPATSTAGGAAAYTATVNPTPGAGTVAFEDGTTAIAGCAAIPVKADGTAPCSTTALTVGPHQITAAFSGTTGFTTSTSSPLTTTITEGRAAQAITFTSTPPTGAVIGGTYAVAATGGASGQSVTFGTTTGAVCTMTGSAVTFTHPGTCTVTADQAGNADYTPAPQVTQAITVGQAAQAITVTSTPPTDAVVGGTYAVTATGGASGNPVTFTTTGGTCTVSGSTVTFTGSGTCTIAADQAGNVDYTAAPQVTQAITVRATVPGAPTDPVATAGDGAVTVAFTPPTDTGGAPITSYTVTATRGGDTTTATGTGSPITVSGLTNGTAYSFTVAATNSAGTGTASTAVTATPVAATSVNTYDLSGTTTPPSGATSPFGPGSLTATVGATEFTDGALTLPDITIPGYPLFGVLPTTVHARVVPTAPVTGNITNGALTVTSSVNLRIDQISVLGIPLLTPGSTCQTVTPSTLTLSGAADTLQNGGTLTGSYTAANFTGCGFLSFFLEPLLNTTISGIPNTITTTLTTPDITPTP